VRKGRSRSRDRGVARTDLARAPAIPVRAAAGWMQMPVVIQLLPDLVPKDTVRSIVQELIEGKDNERAKEVAFKEKEIALKDNERAKEVAFKEKEIALLEKLIEGKEKEIAGKEKEIAGKEKEIKLATDEYISTLSQYEAVFQPRVMLELALNAKYSEQKRSTMTARWDLFYETEVVDSKGELLPIVKEIISELGCTRDERIICDELKSIYSRLSQIVHTRLEIESPAGRGIFCGGRGPLGRANAVAINLLMKQGWLKYEIKYLNESSAHSLTFVPPKGDIVAAVP
jgi:hypothetical protein